MASPSVELGEFRLTVVSDGDFWVDGGAMFGVVPRVLWSKVTLPDEQNRVRCALNCLLIETGKHSVLIETGIGDKLAARYREIYRRSDDMSLLGCLAEHGVRPEQIDAVVLTHLHFDHCGGSTRRDANGELVPTFPKATYVIQQGEWQVAAEAKGFNENAYPPENFKPLLDRGRVRLVDGNTEIVPGVETVVAPGHTEHLQAVKISSRGRTAVFVSDLIPTSHHLRAHWNSAFDVHAGVTLEQKQRLLDEAARGEWLLFWYHDVDRPFGTVEQDAQGEYVAKAIA